MPKEAVANPATLSAKMPKGRCVASLFVPRLERAPFLGPLGTFLLPGGPLSASYARTTRSPIFGELFEQLGELLSWAASAARGVQ